MALGVGSLPRRGEGERRTVAAALRTAGRVTLWAVLGLLLVRGASCVLAGPPNGEPAASPTVLSDPASSAFAVRFVRAYLGGASSEELAPLLAPGTKVPPRSATVPGVEVEQAEVAGREAVGHRQAIVTVACDLADARTIYLAVPTVREGVDGVAAAGAPAVVAGPAGVGEGVEPPRPIAGPDASAIGELVRRFLPAYFSAASPADLSYLLAPGAVVVPPGNGFQLLAVTAVQQVGDGEGARRTVLATVRVRDPLSGASLPFTYRLELVRHGRWYVDRVAGALS